MQQIRSAMCAPLWSREAVIGVIHVDSPSCRDFTEKDLDLLTALANFARRRDRERAPARARRGGEADPGPARAVSHSPQVVEEIIAHAETTGLTRSP
jgi:hypothetical protein